jgi:hypothetical protein
VAAAIASDLKTLDQVNYCLLLSDHEAQIRDTGGAEKWKAEAKRLIEKRIQLLFDQVTGA